MRRETCQTIPLEAAGAIALKLGTYTMHSFAFRSFNRLAFIFSYNTSAGTETTTTTSMQRGQVHILYGPVPFALTLCIDNKERSSLIGKHGVND